VRQELASYRDQYRAQLEGEVREATQRAVAEARERAYREAEAEARARFEAWVREEMRTRADELTGWQRAELERRQSQLTAELRQWEEAERQRRLQEIEASCSEEWAAVVDLTCAGCKSPFGGPPEAFRCRCGGCYCSSCLEDVLQGGCHAVPAQSHSRAREDFRKVVRQSAGARPRRKPADARRVSMGGAGAAPKTEIAPSRRHFSMLRRP
jgi:hypothetical protein